MSPCTFGKNYSESRGVERTVEKSTSSTVCQSIHIATRYTLVYAICSNCGEQNMITDYSQGVTICLGEDGNGCGGVVMENIPVHTTQ